MTNTRAVNVGFRAFEWLFSGMAEDCNGCAPCKGGAFQWVQIPPGEMLQPEATGAVREVTNWLKPLGKASHELVAARVCRPQRE